MPTRRDLLCWTSAAIGLGFFAVRPGIAGDSALPGNDVAGAALPTGSDLGNLYPLLARQIEGHEPALSFLRVQFTDLESWKNLGREKVMSLLSYAPPTCEPRAEVVERLDRGEYIQERVYFNTTPDIRVPAYVLLPKNTTKLAPAIVALHDHGGFYLWGKEKLVEADQEHPMVADHKKLFYGGRSIAAEMARQGYVVIVIDMFYWGERRMLLDNDPDDWKHRLLDMPADRVRKFNQRSGQNEQLIGRACFASGITWSGIMYWDDIRTVDYLVTRPEVDPKRIGCVGLSTGGLRAMHLAALDPRVKASVVVGWMASFPAQLKSYLDFSIGFAELVPGLYHHLDYPDIAALAMPAAQLAINGRKDGLFEPAGVQASFDKLAACYHKAGIPDRFRGSWYDTAHEFNLTMQAEAWAWLKKWM